MLLLEGDALPTLFEVLLAMARHRTRGSGSYLDSAQARAWTNPEFQGREVWLAALLAQEDVGIWPIR